MTQGQDRDYELSLAALRGDEPAGVDKARLREKLVKRGVALTATASAATASAAPASATPASAVAARSALPLAAKLVGVALLASGVVWTWQAAREPHAAAPLHAPESAALKPREPALSFQPRARELPAAERTPRTPQREAALDLLDLARENALLSQAAAALKTSDLTAARSLLDQHEREFPQGFLRAEREKARRRLAGAQQP
jgi:hypothetical protein